MTDLPKMGIKTQELIDHVEELLKRAYELMRQGKEFGAVNWGDLGVCDVEYRLSVMHANEGPYCSVLIEEASPNCQLQYWLFRNVDAKRFPRTYFECEW